jgi:hypothetical protein
MPECDTSMFDTLLGGVLAILGGWGAAWYAARKARENRMNEIVAERKVSANAEAYSHVKEIQSLFLQSSPEDTLKCIMDREAWFFSTRLFLPGEFPAKWLAVRNDLHKYVRWQLDQSKTVEEKTKLDEKISGALAEAIDEIYKDMKLNRIVLDKKNA